MNAVWGTSADPLTYVVDVYVGRQREKLRDAENAIKPYQLSAISGYPRSFREGFVSFQYRHNDARQTLRRTYCSFMSLR